jgi:hypothetical protein
MVTWFACFEKIVHVILEHFEKVAASSSQSITNTPAWESSLTGCDY